MQKFPIKIEMDRGCNVHTFAAMLESHVVALSTKEFNAYKRTLTDAQVRSARLWRRKHQNRRAAKLSRLHRLRAVAVAQSLAGRLVAENHRLRAENAALRAQVGDCHVALDPREMVGAPEECGSPTDGFISWDAYIANHG